MNYFMKTVYAYVCIIIHSLLVGYFIFNPKYI